MRPVQVEQKLAQLHPGVRAVARVEGQGYMFEALCAAIAWGWAQMDLNRIEAVVHPDNAGSIALLERLGFVLEGRLRQAGYWGVAFTTCTSTPCSSRTGPIDGPRLTTDGGFHRVPWR
jgi:hypothetical protein